MTVWLALVGEAAAGEAQLLIVAGAATPEEGQRALEKAQAALTTWSSVLQPAAGYPKLVDSGTLPGLRPARRVRPPERPGSAAARCAGHHPRRRVPALGPVGGSVCVPHDRLSAGHVPTGDTCRRAHRRGDAARPPPLGRAALVASDGAWLLRADLEWQAAIITCDTLYWEKAGAGLALVASCLRPDCTTPSEERGTLAVTASGGKLVQEESWRVLKAGECD
jgi:hypothetical protein